MAKAVLFTSPRLFYVTDTSTELLLDSHRRSNSRLLLKNLSMSDCMLSDSSQLLAALWSVPGSVPDYLQTAVLSCSCPTHNSSVQLRQFELSNPQQLSDIEPGLDPVTIHNTNRKLSKQFVSILS